MAGIASAQLLLSSRHSQESFESTSLIRKTIKFGSGVSLALLGVTSVLGPSLNQSLARGMEGAIGLALVMCSNPSFLEITFLEGGEAHLPDENQDLLQKIQ